MFTPIIPPNIPSTIPVISIYIVFEFIEKSLFTKLDAKYKIIIYITEITIPLIIPYFFNFILDIDVPINKLTPEIIIIIVFILSSLILVLTNNQEKISMKLYLLLLL